MSEIDRRLAARLKELLPGASDDAIPDLIWLIRVAAREEAMAHEEGAP